MKNSGFQRLNVKKQECKISHQSFVLIEKNMKKNIYITIYKVMSNSLQPHGLHSPWNSPGQNTGVGSLSLLQGIFPTQASNPGLPHWAHSLPAEPQGKPKNTGVDSLFLLQRIFPTQGSNPGLLHCRRILYQLSYQGSPKGQKQLPKPGIEPGTFRSSG